MGSRSIVVTLALLLAAGWFALAGLLEGDREVRASDPGRRGQLETGSASLAGAPGESQEEISTEAAADETASSAEAAREAAPSPPLLAAPAVEEGFRADAIYGEVVDDLGTPLEGVSVLVFDPARRGEQETLLAELTTDAAGRFRHAPVPPLEELGLLFDNSEHVRRYETHLPGVEEDFELQAGAAVGGRVTLAATGEAQDGVTVQLRRKHWDGEDLLDVQAVTTDEAGHYTFDGAPVGSTIELTAVVPGRLPDEQTFRVVEDGRDDCDFELASTTLMAGEVFDLSTGKPISDATVKGGRVGLVTTRADGSFDLQRDTTIAKSYWLNVSAPGYCDTTAQWTPGVDQLGPLRIPLLRGARVEGHVRFEDESPCAGGQLYANVRNRSLDKALYPLYPTGINLRFRSASGANRANTGADGSYSFSGLMPGKREARVSFSGSEFGRTASQTAPIPTPGCVAVIDFTLEVSGTVRGIVEQDGTPARARVEWWTVDHRGNGRANDGGQFLLRGVPVAEIQMRAKAPEGGRSFGRNEADPEGQRVTVAAGEESWVELTLEDLNEPIEGFVLDAARQPVAGAEINAWAHDQTSNRYGQDSGTTDADGHFALSVPAMSIPYEVYVSEGARSTQKSGVAPGTTDLEFVLPQAGTLALKVVDRVTDEPVEGYVLYGRELGEEKFESRRARGGTVPDSEGFVEFEFSAGTYDLVVVARGKGYRDETLVAVTVPPEGRRVEQRAALTAGTAVTVTILPAEEGLAPLEGAVLLLAEGETIPRSRWRNDLSRVIWRNQEVTPGRKGEPRTAKGLTPGIYRVVAQRGGYEFDPAEIEVPEMDTHAVTVHYRPKADAGANAPATNGDSSVLLGYFGD